MHWLVLRAAYALVADTTLIHLLNVTKLSICIYTLKNDRSSLGMAGLPPEIFLALPYQIVYIPGPHLVCPLSSILNITLSFLLIQLSRLAFLLVQLSRLVFKSKHIALDPVFSPFPQVLTWIQVLFHS